MSTESRYSPVSYAKYYYGSLYSIFVSIVGLIGRSKDIVTRFVFFKVIFDVCSKILETS